MYSYFLIAFLALYLFLRLSRGITRSATCLVGKTAIVTGANSGLGYQIALNLAGRGCRVIMADVSDMEESKHNIIKYTNNTKIVTKKIDLSSLKSVRDFAEDINKTEDNLHILMNNAGMGVSDGNRTKDGLYPLMQINYFGHFLLTHLLIDLLKKSSPSRIVFTSSILAFTHNLSVNNLNYDEGGEGSDGTFVQVYNGFKSYSNSKLAMIIASDLLGEKLKGTGVTSNSAHPGLVKTPIFKKAITAVKSLFCGLVEKCINMFFSKDPWEGSQTLVHAAVSKRLEGISGRYFMDCRTFVKPRAAYDKKFCREIWEASEKLVGLKPHEKL